MDVGNLAADKTTHQHVGRLANRARASENVLCHGMSPPAAAERFTSDRLSQSRNRTVPRFEDHPIGLHKGNSLLRRHSRFSHPLATGRSNATPRSASRSYVLRGPTLGSVSDLRQATGACFCLPVTYRGLIPRESQK